ncbi:MAG: glycosyltransferase family 39 protein [Faecalibacterium sp.]|nr:glycosyltransferase family 39 protein [Faecalibacterium sp.]
MLIRVLRKIPSGMTFFALVVILLGFVSENFVRTVLLAGVIGLAAWAVFVRVQTLSDRACRRLQLVLCAAQLVMLAVFACNLAVAPAWDFGRVYHATLDITTHGRLAYTNDYFMSCYNNFFLTWLLVIPFKVFSVFGVNPLAAGIILNIAAIACSYLFLMLAADLWFSWQRGTFFGICCLVCFPLATYAPVFYTDTLSMPFAAATVLIAVVLYKKNCSPRQQAALALLLGAVLFFGFKIKPTAAIPAIALALDALLRKRRGALRFMAAVVCVFAVMYAGYQFAEKNSGVIDLTDLSKNKLTVTHYVMMGLKGHGEYNPDDHAFSASFATNEERQKANVEEIVRRLKEYGPDGYLKFLFRKIRYTWTDGTYFGPETLNIDPLGGGAFRAVFTSEGQWHPVYAAIMKGAQLLLIAGMLVALFSKDPLDWSMSTAVLGIFLFLLFWETRSRYLVNMLPVFMLLYTSGMELLWQKWNLRAKANR